MISGVPASFGLLYTAMSSCTTSYNADGRAFQVAASPVYLGQKPSYRQISTLTGDMLAVYQNIALKSGAGQKPHVSVQGAASTYNKVRAGVLIAQQPGYTAETVGCLTYSTTHEFTPVGAASDRNGIGAVIQQTGVPALGIAPGVVIPV